MVFFWGCRSPSWALWCPGLSQALSHVWGGEKLGNSPQNLMGVCLRGGDGRKSCPSQFELGRFLQLSPLFPRR